MFHLIKQRRKKDKLPMKKHEHLWDVAALLPSAIAWDPVGEAEDEAVQE